MAQKPIGHHSVNDAGSETGTLVNGQTVSQCELKLGDEIEAGSTRLRLQACVRAKHAELTDGEDEGVAHWLAQLLNHDEQAYQQLWDAFFP